MCSLNLGFQQKNLLIRAKPGVELGFTPVMGAGGLLMGLGLGERKRSFAILAAIGATKKQKQAFIWAEIGLVGTTGLVVGSLLGLGLAQVLALVLHGVFDPPPEHLALPWLQFAIFGGSAIVSLVLAGWNTSRWSLASPEALREL